jgi:hypothetical protein
MRVYPCRVMPNAILLKQIGGSQYYVFYWSVEWLVINLNFFSTIDTIYLAVTCWENFTSLISQAGNDVISISHKTILKLIGLFVVAMFRKVFWFAIWLLQYYFLISCSFRWQMPFIETFSFSFFFHLLNIRILDWWFLWIRFTIFLFLDFFIFV